MADKPPPGSPISAFTGIGENLRIGLGGQSQKALAEIMRSIPLTRLDESAMRAAERSSESRNRDLEPALAGSGKTPTKRRPRRTSLDRIPGRRAMKEYPVTGEELLTLGIMQGGAAIMLAFAGTCFGFYLSTKQTIDFAGNNVAQATVGWWAGMGDAAWYLAIVASFLGIALAGLSGFKVRRIMKATDHG